MVSASGMVGALELENDSAVAVASSRRVERIMEALVSELRSRRSRIASSSAMLLSIRIISTTTFLDSLDRPDSSL